MDVRPSGSAIEIKETQLSKALSPMEVTPSGTTACPLASGVYRQPAVTPPSESSTKIVVSTLSVYTAMPQARACKSLYECGGV